MYDIKQITNYDLQDFDTEIINDIQYAVIPLSFLGTPIVKLGYCITNPSGIGSSFFIKINNEQYEIIMGETGMYEINMDVYYDSSGKHTVSPAVTEVKVPKKYDFTLDYILIDKETYMAETTIKGSGISRWKSNKKYNVDDVVVYESDIYMCLEENQRKHFNKQDWEKIGGYKQNDYILPPASKDRLGGIKVGDGLRIDDGYLSVRNISSGSGNGSVLTISWEEFQSLSEEEKNNGTVYYIPDAPYSNGELPIATSNKIGGIKVGNGLKITREGVLSSSGGISPDNFEEEDFDVSSENVVSLNSSQRMVEITEAEYNALTVDEQNNGTAYLIKDKNDYNNYYGVPQKTGRKWIDGKDIYECTYSGFNLKFGTSTWVDTTIPIPDNAKKLIKATVLGADTSNTAYPTGVLPVFTAFHIPSNHIHFYSGFCNAYFQEITIEYTM